MIVLDVETSGVSPHKNSLLSIGAIDFQNPSNTFYEECRAWDGAHIDHAALAVNGYSMEQAIDPRKKLEADIVRNFFDWVSKATDHTIAGQNPFFDTGFLTAASERGGINFPLAHRIIDLHSITYFHMIRRGATPPLRNSRTDLNSDTIMEYVGIPAEPKPHIALNGAKWEAEAFSRLFHEKSLFPEFEKHPIPWHVGKV